MSGMWLGVDLRMDTQTTCVYKRLDYVFKHHSRLNSQHNGGALGRFKNLTL